MPQGIPKYVGKIEDNPEIMHLYTVLSSNYRYLDGVLYTNTYYGKVCEWRLAPTHFTLKGYKMMHIAGFDNRMLVHRVVFLMHHKYLPTYIDHIDRDKSNNKIENLKETTALDNMLNRGIKSTNTSGCIGVWYRNGYWVAEATKNYKKYCLGSFTTKEEAHAAYLAKREELDN